ncbi:low-specificity L-threonine aldolase [Holdemania filiformis]|uniref:low-specificity L-threonine aldolase n=1 Tax=Holdemania filiformis TaxID=61171 RepID=UPI00242B3123|nr:low-specificity L-threonine aldolase [Holdemania filiformis]
MKILDLRSDTVTQPTPEMREAIASALVGDDVYGDDPTVNELERQAAERLGKEAALFVSSGTMGNLLGVQSQTQRGDEVILGARSHIITHEVGHLAQICQCMGRTIDNPDDRIYPDDIRQAIRPDDIHEPPTTLLCLENALSNGTVVPLELMRQDYAAAKEAGLNVHLDGARLFNAATALSVDAAELAACADSVTFCLSKGLCAPVGSMLCGTKEFIARARRNRKRIGGGLRQAGFLAAAGLIAMNQMSLRLGEDHANAKTLAAMLEELDGVAVAKDQLDINMIFLTLNGLAAPERFVDALKEQGILINGADHGVYRLVTHWGIETADLPRIAAAIDRCRKEL